MNNNLIEPPKAKPIDHSTLEIQSRWALESNFRVIGITSELAESFQELYDQLEDGHPARATLDHISRDILRLFCQSNFTGRQLAGALEPCKSVPTCQNSLALDIFSLIQAIKRPQKPDDAFTY